MDTSELLGKSLSITTFAVKPGIIQQWLINKKGIIQPRVRNKMMSDTLKVMMVWSREMGSGQ